MSCREFNSGRLTLDVTDKAAIRYLVSRVDDVDDGNESTGDALEDDNDEDDSDDDDVDEELHKMATEIATKTDDSSFHSDTEDNPWLEGMPPHMRRSCWPRTVWHLLLDWHAYGDGLQT